MRIGAETGSLEEIRKRAEEAALDGSQKITFEEGFTSKTMIGALFVALIMLPGALYLGLVAGASLGPAAQWVTIVLFAEIAKRSFVTLKRQEIYVLFYVAGALVSVTMGHLGLSGGAFSGLIWNQYYVQSPQAADIATQVPRWIVPQPESTALLGRTFFHSDWLVPILVILAGEVFGRMKWLGLGYVLFRMTSDTERLPFPFAPVAAAGATALAEAQSKEESWRWQVFSIGTMLGLVFGFFYLAVPIFTGVVFSKPLMLIPIPFIDFTRNTETILPAALTGITGDLTLVLVGFVLPFQIVIAQAISSIAGQVALNPILHAQGMLPMWRPGMGTIETKLAVDLDFWMSVGIGVGVAIGVIGLFSVLKSNLTQRSAAHNRAVQVELPEGRGDFPISLAVAAWAFATIGSIILCHKLVPLFPLWILIGFGLFYSPIMSYIQARMFGMTGQHIEFPFIREATFLKSGYPGVDIWFAPIPLVHLGWAAQRFREVELTGTKFTSILKAEIFMLPVMLLSSFLFWAYFWHTNPIPSPQFPFAQKFWPLQATMQTLWVTSNMQGEESFLMQALKPPVMVWSGLAALGFYGILASFKMPLFYFYGAASGIGIMPHMTIPMAVGAILGRYYFAKRFGLDNWRVYAPVLLAGFSCGMGLMGMTAIALTLISQSVSYLPY